MSKTIAAVMVQILALGLPMVGIEVGNEELTTSVQTILVIASGFMIWYERVKKGDVDIFGRKA